MVVMVVVGPSPNAGWRKREESEHLEECAGEARAREDRAVEVVMVEDENADQDEPREKTERQVE